MNSAANQDAPFYDVVVIGGALFWRGNGHVGLMNRLDKQLDALSCLTPTLSGRDASTPINARNAGYVG
jgi:hypothetical protein